MQNDRWHADPLWREYLSTLDDPRDAEARCIGSFRIGDSPEAADRGAELVLSGRKTTTSALVEELERTGEARPAPGALSVLENGAGEAVAVVETLEVEEMPLDAVGADFALEYGEWDRTLETWRSRTRAYYSGVCERLGIAMRRDLPLLCETFVVVHPRQTAGRLVARTPRLELRQFSPDGAAAMFALNNHPEAIRYTGDAPFASVDDARDFLERYEHYRHHRFGRWSVYHRESGEYLGFCGLRREPADGSVDLGFRIAPRHWGRGYATEAARASLALGLHRFGLERIIARAMPDNLASHRVLAKLGFTRAGQTTEPDGSWTLYELATRA